MTTGEKIKQLRISLGMSQEELGAKAGLQKAAIYKYEKGLVVNIKRDVLQAIANALHTTPAYIMGWDEYMDPEDQKFLESLGPLKPAEKLPEDIQAINVLLYECGERITRVDGEYYLGECGLLSEDDVAYLKNSAVTSVKVAVEMLRKKAKKELKESLNRMDRR